jgi:hypothetical protein
MCDPYGDYGNLVVDSRRAFAVPRTFIIRPLVANRARPASLLPQAPASRLSIGAAQRILGVCFLRSPIVSLLHERAAQGRRIPVQQLMTLSLGLQIREHGSVAKRRDPSQHSAQFSLLAVRRA